MKDFKGMNNFLAHRDEISEVEDFEEEDFEEE